MEPKPRPSILTFESNLEGSYLSQTSYGQFDRNRLYDIVDKELFDRKQDPKRRVRYDKLQSSLVCVCDAVYLAISTRVLDPTDQNKQHMQIRGRTEDDKPEM